jgi:hypothetical protein
LKKWPDLLQQFSRPNDVLEGSISGRGALLDTWIADTGDPFPQSIGARASLGRAASCLGLDRDPPVAGAGRIPGDARDIAVESVAHHPQA